MEASLDNEFQHIVEEVFKKLKTNEDFLKLRSDMFTQREVKRAMQKTLDELKQMMSHTDSLQEALGHLSAERNHLIRGFFCTSSFKAELKHRPDGTIKLLFKSPEGKPLSYFPSVTKIDEGNHEEYKCILAAKIVLEILVMNFTVLQVIPSEQTTAETVKRISSILASYSDVLCEMTKMAKLAQQQDLLGVGKCIVTVLLGLYTPEETPVIHMTNYILKDISWKDKIVSVCQLLCFITTSSSSAGTSAVAKVTSWLLYASSFLSSIRFLQEFEDIRFT